MAGKPAGDRVGFYFFFLVCGEERGVQEGRGETKKC
jgi:hypothetical protein